METVERRRWERLQISVPMFLHRVDERSGKTKLDFATALDISVGGILLAAPSFVSPESEITLEIPEAPIVTDLTGRKLRARVVRAEGGRTFRLGLEFAEASRLKIAKNSRAGE